ncbi:Ubiquitin carboxyl-terminal hydrolase 16 [Linnemannia zychae]|nr:Ubiquitin carboxyl-terminal hydrolase 16 [Linnemannia zychae]
MTGKRNRKQKKPKKGGQKQNGGDDLSATEDAILAQAIAESQEAASIATLEESALSEAIAFSLQTAKDNADKLQDSTPNGTVSEGVTDASPRTTREDSGDNLLMDALGAEEFVTGIENCPHLKEAAKLPRIRKVLTATHPAPDLDHCHGCRAQHAQISMMAQKMGIPLSILTAKDPIDDLLEPLPLDALWLCLACSEINCGRMFKKHALGHHDKVTTNHPLAMNLGSMDIWCYDCDDNIVTSKDKNPILQECQTLLARALQAKQSRAREKVLARSKKSKGDKDNKIKIHAPGLQNLGNTCFFNSVMQVLVETKSLRDILTDNHSSNSISATTRTGLGPLTTTFKDFLFTMWKQQGGIVTPRDLFTQIAKKWKVFRGFREQDSQELMRHLLEGIRQEEANLIQKRLEEERGNRGDQSETAPPKYVPFIETCFAGKLVSVIVCDACKKCSYAYEDYYDLSLPMRGNPVSLGSGSLMDRLKARSRLAGYELSRNIDPNDDQAILEADQGTEEHWRHVEKLLKNVPSQSNSEALSVEKSLIQFTNVDLLDGENKFACENCYKLVQSYNNQNSAKEEVAGKEDEEKTMEEEKSESSHATGDKSKSPSNAILRRAYKRYLVSTLPSTLVLHLKRFEHVGTTFGLMKKIEDHVDIPTEIDMAPFCIPKGELYDETESGVKDLAITETSEERGSTKYRLYGATVHQGSLATGHYSNFVLSSKVEVPPPAPSAGFKPAATAVTTAISNGVEIDLPDISFSQIQAQRSKKKKKKGGGSVGNKVVNGANTVSAARSSSESVSAERPVDKDKGIPDSTTTSAPTQAKDNRQWICCSDTQVRSATLDEVLASRPYILYYERC